MFSTEGRGGVTEFLIEWDRDVDVLVTMFPPPRFGRQECC